MWNYVIIKKKLMVMLLLTLSKLKNHCIYFENFYIFYRVYSRKPRHACSMNKKGQTLVYLGQIKDDSPLNSSPLNSLDTHLRFFERESAKKIKKGH